VIAPRARAGACGASTIEAFAKGIPRGSALSNWTELDVWQDIAEEAVKVSSNYLAHGREARAQGRGC
jgi:3'-phosphoadenosine 5'-phosphosulfate sulfotransferase (PAPS reductase)/FAD synthetase